MRVSAGRSIASAVALVACVLAVDASARQALDRTKVPAPGKTPDLRVPTWTKTTLANGADLIVSEKHDLPLVSFSITFLGGANQFEPAERTGARERHRRDDERGHEDPETEKRCRTRSNCSALRCRRPSAAKTAR